MGAQSFAQARAKHAWEAKEALVRSGRIGDEADHAKKLPIRIKTCGLAQSLAFLRAKGHAEGLRRALADWVMPQLGKKANRPDDLLEFIIKDHAATLQRATAESLAWLEWFTRFAEPHRKDNRKDK